MVATFQVHKSVDPAGLDGRAFRKLKGLGKAQVRILLEAKSNKLLVPDKTLKSTL